MAEEDHRFATAVELAKVALTSIVTSCSGLLIGLFAYAGQRGDALPEPARYWLKWAVIDSGAGLWLAILSALLGYLSELAYHNKGNNGPFWLPAFGCAVTSILLLGAAMVCGGMMLGA